MRAAICRGAWQGKAIATGKPAGQRLFGRLVARVMLRVLGQQPGGLHGGVDLRGADAGMAEHFLDGAQIRAPPEQMRGEGRAQEMRFRTGAP